MEHGSNNCKHHCEPRFNHDIFRHGNKFQWLLTNGLRNSYCWLVNYSCGHGITCDNLRGRIKHPYCHWRYILSVEHR